MSPRCVEKGKSTCRRRLPTTRLERLEREKDEEEDQGTRGQSGGSARGQDQSRKASREVVPRSGGLQGSLPRQASSASSAHSPGAADEAFTGGFPLFPQTSAGLGSHSGSELPPESSPSTRRAHAVPMVPEDDRQRRSRSPRLRRTATSG